MEQTPCQKCGGPREKNRCWPCRKEYLRQYRKANPDKVRRYRANFMETHSESERERLRVYRETHREELKAYNEKYRQENIDKLRQYDLDRNKTLDRKGAVKRSSFKSHLKKFYDLAEEDYWKMVEDQNGCCALCLKPPRTRLVVDHCHEDGKKVRALLCDACNTALGHFDDSVDMLKAAIAYLEKHSSPS